MAVLCNIQRGCKLNFVADLDSGGGGLILYVLGAMDDERKTLLSVLKLVIEQSLFFLKYQSFKRLNNYGLFTR